MGLLYFDERLKI